MKFSVGFQLYENGEETFSDIVRTYNEYISEVFFAWPEMPSGRGDVLVHSGDVQDVQQRMERELNEIKEMGVKLDLLFNANCYGAESLSEKLACKVCSVIEHLESVGCGVEIVTTTSLAIAHTVKKFFPQIEVRASVNMKIGTIKGMEYVSDLFDSFHVQREYNRDLAHLNELKNWADKNGKKLVLLANSGCFTHCSGQIFHDNNVAHESEICKMQNIEDFNPYVCWRSLRHRSNLVKLLQNTWIRPEDIHNYEGIFDTVKLATRIHRLPGLVIDAYSRRRYFGNVLDLFEPTFSASIAPFIIDNSAFPKNWFDKTSTCDKICYRCNYCDEVLKKVLMNTGDFDEFC